MSNAAAEHFVKLIAVTFLTGGDFRSPDLGAVDRNGLETHLQTAAKEDAFDPIVCRASARLCREKALAPAATSCIGLRRRRSDGANVSGHNIEAWCAHNRS